MPPLHLLETFLARPDFRVGLRELGAPFRKKLGLPKDLDELGLVCPDVVEAATWLETNFEGMGPFFLSEASPADFREFGKKVPYRTRVGFGYYKGVLLELAEAGAGSDIFSTHLDAGSRITIQHLGFFARGPKHRIGEKRFAERMAANGHDRPRWQAEVFAGINALITIYDTYADADNLAIEFLDYRLAGIPVDYPKKIGEMLARLQVKHGPRVMELPGGSGEPLKLQWSFHASRILPGTPAELWPWVTDPKQMSRWMGGTVTGPVAKVGAERRMEIELDGEQAIVTEVLREVHAPQMWTSESKRNDLFHKAQTVLTLTSEGTGTRLVWQVSFVPETTFRGLELAEDGDEWMDDSLDRLARLLK